MAINDTRMEAALRLTSKNSLINTYISEDLHMMYTLHHNGTLLCWNADTLSLENSYTYAVDRQILMSDYSEEHALLCFDTISQQFLKYNTEEQKLTHGSIELYSNFLLYGCNFNSCTGLYHNPRVYMWGPYTGEHVPTELLEDFLL